MSVSSPFFTPSVGEGAAQTESLQTSDSQSAFAIQPSPGFAGVSSGFGLGPSGVVAAGAASSVAGGAVSAFASADEQPALAAVTTAASDSAARIARALVDPVH
jgi:hypothetical protein